MDYIYAYNHRSRDMDLEKSNDDNKVMEAIAKEIELSTVPSMYRTSGIEIPYLEIPPGSFKLNESYSHTPVSVRVVEKGTYPNEDEDGKRTRLESLRSSDICQLLSYGEDYCTKGKSDFVDNTFVSYDCEHEEFVFLNGATSRDFEIHVELNRFFPFEVANLVVENLRQAVGFLNFPSELFDAELSPYIRASIYFDACGYILRNTHPLHIDDQLEKYHPIRAFRSGLPSEQMNEQFESLQSFRYLSEGPIHIVNCVSMFHQFLFYGLCLDKGSSIYNMLDINRYHQVDSKVLVFAGEYSSFLVVRKRIISKFKLLQEMQLELFKRMERKKRKKNSLFDEEIIRSRNPLDWRRKSEINAPHDWKVQDFDPENPRSILSNVPKDSKFYKKMDLLCTAYGLELKSAQRIFPGDWTEALRHFFVGFDLESFAHAVGIQIIPSPVNGNFMLREFLSFRARHTRIDYILNDFKNKEIIPNDLGLNLFIADRKFVMKSGKEIIANLEPKTEAKLVAKYGQTSYITINSPSSSESSYPATKKRQNELSHIEKLDQLYFENKCLVS